LPAAQVAVADFIAVVHLAAAVVELADTLRVQFQFQQEFLIQSQSVLAVPVVQQVQGPKEVQRAVIHYSQPLEQPCKVAAAVVA
jgi:hypothetical protein